MADLTLTWLGHAAFRFDTPGGKRIYLDPFLNGNPKCPENEVEPERVDLIAVTHGHNDHVGDTPALHKKFGCDVLAPVELADWLCMTQGVSQDKVHDPNKGGTVEWEGIKITLVHAQHSSSFNDGESMTYTGEPVGFVFEFEDGTRVYTSGDTNVFGDMQLIARLYKPEIAILPIGGHYTMDPHEASVALELLGVRTCIPSHYGTFPVLKGTPDELRELTDVEVVSPQPGETITLGSRVAA